MGGKMEGDSAAGVGSVATVTQVVWVGMIVVGRTMLVVGVAAGAVHALMSRINRKKAWKRKRILRIARYYKVRMPGEFAWHS
jgi:hypothetical protein